MALRCSPSIRTADQQLYVGIFGGHHESSAVLFDASSLKLVCTTWKPLNHHTYVEAEVSTRLSVLTRSLMLKAGITQETELFRKMAGAAFAMPGIASDDDLDVIDDILRRSLWPRDQRVQEVDDTWAGLVAGASSYSGICAVAGTGASVAIGQGQLGLVPIKIDGWGPIIGDYGSGFQVAVDLFRFLCRAKDHSIEPPPLFHQLVADFAPQFSGFTKIDQLAAWFDIANMVRKDNWRLDFAALAKTVVVAADAPSPDHDAVELITSAANDICDSIKLALHWAGDDIAKSLPVVMQGGMFTHSRLYRDIVRANIRKLTCGHVDVSYYHPLVGALAIALAERGPMSQALVDRLVEPIAEAIFHTPEYRRLLTIELDRP